jgi:nitroreductase/Pyruvate/2-oxoacid:ferredoxin oxidoreductase delta subunit
VVISNEGKNIMALLEVNKQACTKCGLCAAVCPAHIIYYRENSYPRLLPKTDGICIRCGHCVAVCHSASLAHLEVPLEGAIAIDSSLNISFDQAAQLIKGRRSVREFKDKKVPREEIERIIDVARYAPTGHNNQEVRWLVIDDPATLRRIADIGGDWLAYMIQTSPLFRAMFEGIQKQVAPGTNTFIWDAPAVVIAFAEKGSPIASTDCVIAASYFDLAATSAGLGCCWAGFLQIAAASYPAMIEAVALPEGCAPYGCLMVGYPRYRYQRAPARKPAGIVYRNGRL